MIMYQKKKFFWVSFNMLMVCCFQPFILLVVCFKQTIYCLSIIAAFYMVCGKLFSQVNRSVFTEISFAIGKKMEF